MDHTTVYETMEKLEPYNPSNDGDVNCAYIYALSIIKEIAKFKGDPTPIFGHGYLHEKIWKLQKIAESR